jgi:hypothetical protein
MEDVCASGKTVPAWVLHGLAIITSVEATFIQRDLVRTVVTVDVGGIKTSERLREIGWVWDSNVHGTIACTVSAVCAAGTTSATSPASDCHVATTASTASPSTRC